MSHEQSEQTIDLATLPDDQMDQITPESLASSYKDLHSAFNNMTVSHVTTNADMSIESLRELFGDKNENINNVIKTKEATRDLGNALSLSIAEKLNITEEERELFMNGANYHDDYYHFQNRPLSIVLGEVPEDAIEIAEPYKKAVQFNIEMYKGLRLSGKTHQDICG